MKPGEFSRVMLDPRARGGGCDGEQYQADGEKKESLQEGEGKSCNSKQNENNPRREYEYALESFVHTKRHPTISAMYYQRAFLFYVLLVCLEGIGESSNGP